MYTLTLHSVVILFPLLTGVGAADPETVELRGETRQVWPLADLRTRGLEVQDIPREQNAAWIYIEAVNAYEDIPAELSEAFDYAIAQAWPTQQPKLTEYLKRPGNQRALTLARKAAAMERCQMPYFGEPDGTIIGVLLPNLSMMRFLAKLLVADGQRLEAEGHYGDALNDYLACARMGAHVAQGVTLIEDLVGIATWNLTQRRLANLVLRRDLDARQLQKLQKALADPRRILPECAHGMRQERLVGLEVVDELCSRPVMFLTNLQRLYDLGFGQVNAHPRDGWGHLEKRVGQLLLPDRAIKEHMSQYYDLLIARAEQGPRASRENNLDADQLILSLPSWDLISRILLPSLSRATELAWAGEARLYLLRGVVALRLHMVQHEGQPPADLQALTEKLPAGALEDIYSGELLRYEPDGTSWLLYSIGPDGKDDGGVPGERWEELDMVHRYPPLPVEPFVAEKSEADGKP